MERDTKQRRAIREIFTREHRPLSTDEVLAAGRAAVVWDGRTDAGSRVPAGVYLVRVRGATEDGQSASAVGQVYIGR